MKPASFKSDFALLDVKLGRTSLMKRVERGEKIRIRVEAVITGVWGGDDGVSREFELEVTSVKEYEGKK